MDRRVKPVNPGNDGWGGNAELVAMSVFGNHIVFINLAPRDDASGKAAII